jgi:ABC-type transport system involved in cytochrome c biogenesis permease subunit
METLLVHIALLAYAAGATSFLAWLVRPVPRRAQAGRWLLRAGVVIHLGAFTVSLGLAGLGLGALSWNGGQLFSLLAGAIVAIYLMLDRDGRMPLAGAFVAPLTVGVMVPAHLVPSWERMVAPQLRHSAALFVHVTAATFGTAALALAFGLSALYLAGERQAKSRRPGRLFARLTSLDSIDRSGYRLAVWGFVFLSIAIGTGSLASNAAAGSLLPIGPKETFAVLAWVLLAAMIQARLVAGWRGRRIAVLVVIGFVLIAGTYAGLLSAAPALASGGAQ